MDRHILGAGDDLESSRVMIVQSVEALDTTEIVTEICIIGGGAAGITLAQSFFGTKTKVVLIEGGGTEFDYDSQELYEGESVGAEYFGLTETRLRFLGGTTNHWGGTCARFPPGEFAGRSWVADSTWPITYDAVAAYYPQAHEICDLRTDDYDLELLEDLLAGERLPLDGSNIESFVKRYSPPTRFGEKYLAALDESENVTVLLNSTVTQIVPNAAASHIEKVECLSMDRKPLNVVARQFVVACGGMENPRLLLLSNRVERHGLGNRHDVVGRYFMDHTHRSLGQIVPSDSRRDVTLYDGDRWRRRKGIEAVAMLSPTWSFQQENRTMGASIELSPVYSDEVAGLLGAGKESLDTLGQYLRNKNILSLSSYRDWLGFDMDLSHFEVNAECEQAPNRDSRILLSDQRDKFGQPMLKLDWKVDDFDTRSIELTAWALAEAVGASAVGRMKVDVEIDSWPAGHHHMGSTRMSDDPVKGVVDGDSRVHGIDNLYVAGSSVFTTGGPVNPTLTIVALSLRLADKLKETVE